MSYTSFETVYEVTIIQDEWNKPTPAVMSAIQAFEDAIRKLSKVADSAGMSVVWDQREQVVDEDDL
jgi:hypothetical protein